MRCCCAHFDLGDTLRKTQKLILNKQRYQPKELAEDEEEGAPEEVALCAICIEPFRKCGHTVSLCNAPMYLTPNSSHQTPTTELGDEVMEGIQCHHEYHHPCMMEWLKKHDDCPVCRKSMWTREAFIEAKKQVFKENPGTLEMELAAFAAGELAVTEAAGTTAEDGDESGNLERVA